MKKLDITKAEEVAEKKRSRAPSRRVKAIADAAVGLLIDKRETRLAEEAKKPFWLARGHHTDPVSGVVTVTQIDGKRPDRHSPSEKRSRALGARRFHGIPIDPKVVTTVNPLSGKTHTVLVPRIDGRGRAVVRPMVAGWQTRMKGHRSGSPDVGPPNITNHQRRLIRRYRAQFPTFNNDQLMGRIVEDMIKRAKKLEARAAA